MSAELPPRRRARAIAAGRAAGLRLVVPLALRAAARISARPIDRFLVDPTQLANGLKELRDAVLADGICLSLGDGMEREALGAGPPLVERLLAGARVATALEAGRRLRATVGDGAVLLAGLTGPAQLARETGLPLEECGALLGQLARHFCEAGADVVLLREPTVAAGERRAWVEVMRTIGNIARFFRALPYCLGDTTTQPASDDEAGLPAAPACLSPWAAAPGPDGLCLTPEELPDEVDIAELRAWVRVVSHRG